MAKVVLPRPGGTVEEDVRQRLTPLVSGRQGDLQPLGHGPLADDLAETLRSELLLERIDRAGRFVVRVRRVVRPLGTAGDDGFTRDWVGVSRAGRPHLFCW